MPDAKVTGLTENSNPISTDLLYMVDDPGGTALSQKITFANVSKGLVADNIPNTPAGTIIATDIQAAINELDTEKLALAGGTMTGSILINGTVSIGATGNRVTKGWFIDLEVTNAIAGSITGNAATVSTITGLAPDTATTQATQPNITTCTGLTQVGEGLTIGTGAAGVDPLLDFTGETSSGRIQWMEDEAEFRIGDQTNYIAINANSVTTNLSGSEGTTIWQQTNVGNTTFRIQGNGASNARMELMRGDDNNSWTRYQQLATSQQISYGSSTTQVIWNSSNLDVDFAIRGLTDNNAFKVVAGNDRVGIGTATPAEKLEVNGNVKASSGIFGNAGAGSIILGQNGSSLGEIVLRNGTNANQLTISAATFSANHIWTLPAAQGAANALLQNNGSGVLSWSASLTLSGLSVAADTDVSTTLGRVLVSSPVADTAYFSHVDRGNTADFAIRESQDGTTCVNSSASKLLNLCIGGVTKAFLDANGKFGIGTAPSANENDLLLNKDGVLAMKETTTPTADSGFGKIYTKTDNKLYVQTGDGVEHEVAFV